MICASLPVRRCVHALFLAAGAALAGCGGGGGGTLNMPISSLGGSQSPQAINATPVASAQIDAAVAKLDQLAGEVMQRSKIPGMAVAVVKDGQVVYAKGFGVRRVGSTERVDAGTVFQLASVSKPIAATVVAGLVGGNTVSWDTPAARPRPPESP